MGSIAQRQRKYFVLNKEADFQKGFGRGIRTGEKGITLQDDVAEGVYYTKVFDSGERRMIWHRLSVTGDMLEKSVQTVTVYASDSQCVRDRQETVSEICSDTRMSQEQKDGILQEYCRAEFENIQDALLFQVKGRYLWLKIMLRAQGIYRPQVTRVQIYFPKHTWISYLPEVYEQDQSSASFLERYLGIFQSLYEDMTEKIQAAPGFLEPSSAEKGLLYELADWFSIEKKELWNEQQLRYLVVNAGRIGESRGTVSCMKELIRLYTGMEPYIVEYHQIQPFFDGGKRERLLKELYAACCFEFAVLIDEAGLPEDRHLSMLEQVVEMGRPAHMVSRIIVLRRYIFLNRHSYLGINSVLGQYMPFRLDGSCAVPFSVIAAEE